MVALNMSSKEELNRAFQQLERRYQQMAVERNAYLGISQKLHERIELQAKLHAEECLRLQTAIDTLHHRLAARRLPWWRAAWIRLRATLPRTRRGLAAPPAAKPDSP